MKIKWKQLVLCIAIPLVVGAAAALFSMKGMKSFSSLNQPPLSPPMWLFPVVWTILYSLMGIASYIVVSSGAEKKEINSALWVYGFQLVLNFLWTIIFFSFGLYIFAFIWLIMLWFAILVNTIHFYKINKAAGYLLIPYLIWVAFAGYLNLAIAILN